MSPRAFLLALLGVLAVTIAGAFLDVMEVDAAQYASMSRDMLASDDWLQLHFRGNDYLDKPPLLFWLSALSFKLFGVSNWSYKLPSIAFALLGILATYRFTALHYARETARLAAVMFACSASFLLMTNDVRCDTLLTGSVITAIWLGSAYMKERRWVLLLGCAAAIASGMLAKGPMGLMAPLLALGGEVLLGRRWSVLRDPRLLALPLVIGALLLPMCIGLYEQHGAHGLRFYFWEQSFGRLTGENRWKDDSTVLFFTHELPWLALPWTLFVLHGLWTSMRALIKRERLPEHASLSGALLVFIALSLSQFKLPHYLYVAMPLFAVQGALGWHAFGERWLRWAHWALMLVLLTALLALLVLIAWPTVPWAWLMACVLAAGAAAWFTRALDVKPWLMANTVALWLMIGAVVNGRLYPGLLRYQANAAAGRWAAEHGLAQEDFYGMQVSGTALDFYAGYPVRWLSNAEEARVVIRPGVVIYTDDARYRELVAAGLSPRSSITLASYDVQLIGIDFILPASRQRAVEARHLLVY